MLFVSDIPHLKVNKQKTVLPYDAKVQSMYSMVFINNNTTKAAVDLINSQQALTGNGKYHLYYIDNLYTGKLFGKSYREVLNKERDEILDQIERQTKFTNTEKSFITVNNRNVYFDLQHYNDIFFKLSNRTSSYTKKVDAYLNYLKDIYNDKRFDKYRQKIVVINVDTWVTDVKKNINNGAKLDNPIMFIYFAMLKKFDQLKELGNMNIVFYSGNMSLRLNPSLCEKNSYIVFRQELGKLHTNIQLSDEKTIDKDVEREEVYQKVAKNFTDHFHFTGDDENVDDSEEIEEKVKDRIEEIEKQEEPDAGITGKELEKKLTEKIINDEKLLKDVYTMSQEKKTGNSAVSLKRDQELREKQKQIKINNMTLDDIRNITAKTVKLDKIDVSDKVTTTNKNVTTIHYPHFEKGYNNHLMKKDMINTIMHLNERSIPVFVRNIQVDDNSDELNYKETYTIDLEDSNRVRHRLKFDMPKFTDDKFMYLNGNKKLIVKQLYMKPIVKNGPNEVQVVGSYNKIFMHRYGTKVSAKIEKFKKALLANPKGVVVKFANNLSANNGYKTTIEYDELSKDLTYIRIGGVELYFNQDEVTKLMEERKIKQDKDYLCIGFIDKKTPIVVDHKTQMIGGHELDIVDYILALEKKEINDAFNAASTGKKFLYTRATVMSKDIPLILLLGYFEGLSTVLRKASVQHYFTDTRPKLDISQGSVQFANGYLVYDKYPFENSLLMNAFADIPTKAFNYEDFDTRDVYLSIFDVMYKQRNLGNALLNYYEFMIDPITKEVLEDLNYPTGFVEVMLFANALLTDNSYVKENNMELYRVRSNEVVNAYLYKAIADAYGSYRATANNNNPVKISIPQDAITKKLLMSQTVEDYSILNPIVELEKSRAITPKGHSGMNLNDAYTQDKRSYDKTMLGVLAMSTSPDANCGIIRELTMEPNIKSPRGYIDLKHDQLNELNDANLFSPAELLSPLGVTRDDSIRTAMATKQSKHIIPIEKSSPVLVSNGAEQVIHYHLSNDFSVVAKYNGKVVEVNPDAGIMVVEYKDPKGIPQPDGGMKTTVHQAIDISPRVVKNGAGGFYLTNQLTSDYKVGQTFKKNDILASDKKFFTDSKLHGNRFNIGSLQKVACMSAFSTYEDSTFITKKLSQEMASDIVMQKHIVLGKNANVDHIVKVGDHITVGDELIRFEMSFEDDSLNKFLSAVGDDLKEEIKSLGKTPIKSKYTGEIVDIKIYSTVELDELSPSLRKIVQGYYDRINKKKKVLNKYDNSKQTHKLGVLVNEPTAKVETKDGKVKGNEVGEGVLIEFYISHRDVMGVGDKITFFTALKSIIGDVIPEGLEPYSEYRPEEEVSSFIAPGAVLARMTPSILLTMFTNKVLVELKRQLQEIHTGKPWKPE